MDSDRRDGKPPKHYLDGRKVLYPLGEVLAERARMQAITPEEAKAAALKRAREGEWTFNGFLAQGGLEDTWPIATVRGRPMDFLVTIGMELGDEDIEHIEEMSLEHYLIARLEAGKRERAAVSQQGLQAGTIQAGVAVPALCSKCGREHAGQCRL